MLATLSTLMILTAASFAMIVMFMTLADSWKLVVAALNYEVLQAARPSTYAQSSNRRPIKLSLRSPNYRLSAAA